MLCGMMKRRNSGRWCLSLLLLSIVLPAVALALCDNSIVTSSSSDYEILLLAKTSSAYGALFTVSSPNNERFEIKSLGFHVDNTELGTGDVTYEVYTRLGHYADPERTNGGNGGLPLDATFDYRGKFEYWNLVAKGTFNQFNLEQENYFQIPTERFTNTIIAEGEVRSFYVTLKEVGALLLASLENWEDFGDEQLTDHCWGNGSENWCESNGSGEKQPSIHIGEGVVSYPFYTVPYFYHPKKFMGSIYYVGECATRSPTVAPTKTPSQRPTPAPTETPTTAPQPTTSPTTTASPTPRYFFEHGNKCYWYLSTDAEYDLFRNMTSSTYGMLLPLKSNEEDNNGVSITSLGFHVDFESIRSQNRGPVTYEVYSLIANGQYADTNRTSPKFDYRGDFSYWEKISQGTVTQDGKSDYFQIPFENFSPTYIQPNGGVRSFYLTLNAPVLIYKELDRKQGVGKTQKDDDYNSNRKRGDTPVLMIGEVVIGYPFISADFLYSAKQFVGKIFQDYDCPSQSPSLQPSHVPSQLPSGKPSVSTSPTTNPTLKPSANPSFSPTTSFPPTRAPSDQPSSIPSTSLLPTTSKSPTLPPFQALASLNSSSSLSIRNSLLGCLLVISMIIQL